MLSSLLETRYGIEVIFALLIYSGLTAVPACSIPQNEVTNNIRGADTPVSNISPTFKIKDDLAEKARNLTGFYDARDCEKFFKVFPTTFEELDKLYGYDAEKGPRVLYAKYSIHFPYFFECVGISEKERLNKIVMIGVDGKYNDGSPVDMFNSPIIDLIKKNPIETKKILDGMSDEKAASFWYFLFDVPHPNDSENLNKVKELQDALGKETKQSKLLDNQYKKLLIDWSNH